MPDVYFEAPNFDLQVEMNAHRPLVWRCVARRRVGEVITVRLGDHQRQCDEYENLQLLYEILQLSLSRLLIRDPLRSRDLSICNKGDGKESRMRSQTSIVHVQMRAEWSRASLRICEDGVYRWPGVGP